MAKAKDPLAPSPEQLGRYHMIDSALPALLINARDRQIRREFVYASLALAVAALALVLVLGGFVYLVMQGHPTEAKLLLGAGVLGLIAGFLRARLRNPG